MNPQNPMAEMKEKLLSDAPGLDMVIPNVSLGQQAFNIKFLQIGSDIPWTQGNVPNENEEGVVTKLIGTSSTTCSDILCGSLCCATGIGCCYLYCKTMLIKEGEYGFALNSGRPVLLEPGWHTLTSPFETFQFSVPMNQNPLKLGPVSIVRIPTGYIGTAIENTTLEILLPGTHCRNSGTFQFKDKYPLSQDFIEFEQIKFLTVNSGFVRVCYDNGKCTILKEGKYAINTPSFSLGPLVSIQQQNLKFSEHRVLLDGGIQMLVEGLLTYVIFDVELLVKNVGVDKLIENIQNVTKAEMSKIFSSIHLEQISSITYDEINRRDADDAEDPVENKHNLARIRICQQVIQLIEPLVEHWGVRILNFQLESITMADKKYGQEYESASLDIAKARANLKANAAKNEISRQSATMEAEVQRIRAEGFKVAKVVEAEGNAQAMTTEAKARNEAAKTMAENFSKDLIMMQEKVKFAKELKATTLVISGDSDLTKNIAPMLRLN